MESLDLAQGAPLSVSVESNSAFLGRSISMADSSEVELREAKSRRAFEVIRDRIRDDVVEGLLRPGDKLPAERDLAEKLGFSRAAVREALRGLEATGIVELQKGVTGGAFIRGGDKDMISRSINDVIVLGQIPLRQVMEVRSILLVRAVQIACERATEEEISALEQNVQHIQDEAAEGRDTGDTVGEFYTLIGRMSGNRILEILIDATTSISLNFAISHRIEFTSELIILRRKVVSRLKARDADGAARAISENIAFLHGFVIARAAAHEG